MRKNEQRLPDGRYLLIYSFSNSPAQEDKKTLSDTTQTNKAVSKPSEGRDKYV